MKAPRMLMMSKAVEALTITFTTNKNGTFAPTISTSDLSVATWSVSGETDQTTNTPSFTLTGADETVTLTIADFSKITEFDISSQDIKGAVDLSLLTSCTHFDLDTNSLLSGITNPTSSVITSKYYIYSTGITSLDMSSFSNLAGLFYGYSNTSLTSITFGSSTQTFTAFRLYSCTSLTSVNISNLSGIGSDLRIYGNTSMTTLSLPTTTNTFNIIYLYSNTVLTSIDLSGFTSLGGSVWLHSNTALTTLLFPTSSQSFTALYMYLLPNITTIDCSGLTGLAGIVRFLGNTNMTSIIFPTSSGIITQFRGYSNPSLTSLNCSGLTGLGGTIEVYSCTLLTSITFPTSSQNFSIIYLQGNALGIIDFTPLTGAIATIRLDSNAFTSAEADENIVDIEANINITTLLEIDGTNAALTDGSGTGFDGIQAKDDLVTAGVTVNYN